MRRVLASFILGIIFTGIVAFSVTTDAPKKNLAEVDQISGLYIFVKSKPIQEFEYLGTVKGPIIGNHEFDKLLEVMITRAQKDFPEANALIFDGAIRQSHNTKVSAVRIKD
jgi:hypothetical protein